MKKHTAIYFIMILCFTTFQIVGQNISSITGRVVDKTNEPLLGNVLVLSVSDSSFIQGVTFLDSIFVVSNINRPEVLLKITSLSFADTIIKVVYNGQPNINLGNIVVTLKAGELAAVTVVGKLPLIKHNDNGTMEVNVANTVLATSSSVTEILSKSPNVMENNGQLSVLGKGEALLFLNGRQITNERLASIPVSQILKIEVIANPSSKYDAEGKAVINIITKTKVDEGIMGTASQQVTYSDFAGTNAQSFLDLNYAKNKLSVIGNYSLLLGENRMFLHTTRTRPATDEYLKSDLRTDWRSKMNNYSNYGLGLQYNFDSKNNISMSYNGFSENLGGYIGNKNAITTKTDSSFYNSKIDKDELRTNNSLTLNYNKTVDTLGSVLFVGTQYSHFNSAIDDFITENRTVNGIDGVRQLKNKVGHSIAVSSTQGDFTKVLKGGKKLEMGAKFSYVNTESATDFFIAESGSVFNLDNTLSNKFQYNEKIPAAYFTYSGGISKFNYSAGVRGELTNYQLNTSVGGGQLIADNYFNVFPNLQLSTNVSQNLKLRASYTSRITRPRYQALNPFVVYQDPFTTIEGNANLIPEKTHAFEIGAIYQSADFRIGYNYTLDPLTNAALRGTKPNSYVLKGINIEKSHSFFASITKTITFNWWTSTNTVNLSYTKEVDNQYDFIFIEPTPKLYLYSNNSFNVGKLFKVQLLAWYFGHNQYGLREEYARYLITLGIEKDFLQNKLKLRMLANDIFTRTNASGFYGVGRTDIFYNRTFNNTYFRLIATWNFGQLKKTNFNIKSTGQNENNRVG